MTFPYDHLNRPPAAAGLSTIPSVMDSIPAIQDGFSTLSNEIRERGLSASDYGFSASASAAANATALTDTIAAAVTNKLPVIVPPGAFNFSGLTITDQENITLEGLTRGGELSNTKLLYTGSGTAIMLDRVRESQFGNFQLASDDGTRKLAVAIDIDQLVGTGTNISTHNTLSDIQIFNATVGIRLSQTATANNELHVFERVIPRLDNFSTGLVDTGTIGWLIEDTQSKFHILRDCGAGFCDVGIKLDTGSFEMAGRFNFSHNNTDILILSQSESVTIMNPQSEQSQRFLDVQNATAGYANILVIGGRLDPTNHHSDGRYIKYVKYGALQFHGTDFANGHYEPAWRIYIQGGIRTSAMFVGCTFPNDTPFEGQPQLQKLTVIGCQYIDSASAVKPFPDRLGPAIQIHPAIAVKTANYSMTLADNVVLANTTSGGFTVTLPDITFDDTPTGIDAGHTVTVTNYGSGGNACTIATAGAGSAAELATLRDNESAVFMYVGPSVGNYWKVLSRYTLADSANTAYALVRRDGNGDFSARDANLRDVLATGVVKIDGTQVISNQGAAVADASGGTTVDAEARAAINDLLARLRSHGLIAS